MTGKVSVDVVVVCFNSDPELLQLCIDSAVAAIDVAGVVGRVVLVDNASDVRVESTVGSDDLNVLRMNENVGFGRAINFAVARSQADYILMLNPDAAVKSDCLTVLLSAVECHRGAIVGGWLESNGRVQSDAYMQWDFSVARTLKRKAFGRTLDGVDQDLFAVDKVCGGALFASTSVLRGLGPFDERFFLYGEDADMSRRASGQGIPLVVARQAVVAHVAASSQKTHGRLVERARADAAIRLTAYHRPLAISWLQRSELTFVTLLGAVAGGASSSSRRTRLARLTEIARWGVRRDASAFEPVS